MLAIVPGYQRIAYGLERGGVRQRIQHGQGFGGPGQSGQAKPAIHGELEDGVGLGMGDAPCREAWQNFPPIGVVFPADPEEDGSHEGVVRL